MKLLTSNGNKSTVDFYKIENDINTKKAGQWENEYVDVNNGILYDMHTKSNNNTNWSKHYKPNKT